MIHAFKIENEHILLDVASGSIHCVDEMTYDILSTFNNMFELDILFERFSYKYPKESLKELYNEVFDLYKSGGIYSEDDFEKTYIEKKYVDKGIKAICLNIAHDCNLSCEYCFASKGTYKLKKELMSIEVAKKAVLFLVQNSGERNSVEVDFFGGEPLMNFEVIKGTVEYGKQLESEYGKTINYTITTNGTILNDEIKEFINTYMDNIVISIDGREKVHNDARSFVSKKGSYETVLSNAKEILIDRDKSKRHYIRGTFTKKNLDFSKDVEHLMQNGFTEISVEPVVGTGEDFHLTPKDIEPIKKEYEKLALFLKKERANGSPINFYHFNASIYDGPCIYKRISACGAGFEYLAISPSGEIYPCHQFIGEKDFLLGDLENQVLDDEIIEYFQESNIFSKDECTNCWAKYFCSGGCHANSYFQNRDMRKPSDISCELQKKRIECAIFLEINNLDRR